MFNQPKNVTVELRSCDLLAEMLPNHQILTQMYQDLTQETYEQILPEMISKSYRQVVAEIDGKVVGLVAYWMLPRLWVGGTTLDLDNFVVDENYRSDGVGKILLDHLQYIAQTHGCKMIVLDAYTTNYKAIKFYVKHDFIQKGYHLVREV